MKMLALLVMACGSLPQAPPVHGAGGGSGVSMMKPPPWNYICTVTITCNGVQPLQSTAFECASSENEAAAAAASGGGCAESAYCTTDHTSC